MQQEIMEFWKTGRNNIRVTRFLTAAVLQLRAKVSAGLDHQRRLSHWIAGMS